MLSFIPSLKKESLYPHKHREHMQGAYDVTHRFVFFKKTPRCILIPPHIPFHHIIPWQRSRGLWRIQSCFRCQKENCSYKYSYHGKISRATDEGECVKWLTAAFSVEMTREPHMCRNYGFASQQIHSIVLHCLYCLLWLMLSFMFLTVMLTKLNVFKACYRLFFKELIHICNL